MKVMRRDRRVRGGFTLLELLLVLAILGVLAALVVPNLLGRQQEANINATKTSIHNLEETLKTYAIANSGEFPQGDRDSVVGKLMNPGTDKSGRQINPYLTKAPRDAWDEVLYYEYPTQKTTNNQPAIWSSGPNRQNEDGGGDDVNGWSDEQQKN